MRTPHDSFSPAIALPCSHCEEPGGSYCRRPNGDIAPWTHQARVVALRELERTGPL